MSGRANRGRGAAFPAPLLDERRWRFAGLHQQFVITRIALDEASRLERNARARKTLERFLWSHFAGPNRLDGFVLFVHDAEQTADGYLTVTFDADGRADWESRETRLKLVAAA